MLQISEGLRNWLLSGGSFKAAMDLGFVKFYTGTPPASANDAPTGTLLSTTSVASGGTGLSMASAASGGVLPKASAETWSGLNAASGTAGYFRWVAAGDTGALSTTEKRLQGLCGLASAEMNMSSLGLVSGATQSIDAATVAMPPSA